MKFIKLVPNIFYEDIQIGIKLFIDCLEFEMGYSDLEGEQPCCVARKDAVAVFLIQSKEFAEKDRPELRLHTDNIEEVHAKVASKYPELLHPNGREISIKPWGAKEFALRDESDVCLIIQQWEN